MTDLNQKRLPNHPVVRGRTEARKTGDGPEEGSLEIRTARESLPEPGMEDPRREANTPLTDPIDRTASQQG